MAKYILAVLLAFGAFTSCSRVQAYYYVANGNYQFQRGNYQDANVDYFMARETGIYSDEISYNLGNLYHSLGENSAAVVEWDQVPATVQPALYERVLFNRGVVLYEKGEYQLAYDLFRQVLKLNPVNVSAKINLEYSLSKLSNLSGLSEQVLESGSLDQASSKDVERIFQYIRSKKEGQWRSVDQQQSETSANDW